MNKVLVLLLYLTGGWLFAQPPVTLHVVYNILDQPQDSVFIGCQKDLKGGTDFFTDLGEVTEELGFNFIVEQHHIDFSRAGVERFLLDFPAKPDDAMIFIYSGHGISVETPTPWPELVYCSETDPLIDVDAEQCVMPLDEIHLRLRKTPLRMTLVIGSSCNKDGDGPHNNTLARILHGSKVPKSNADGTGLFENLGLFTEYEGHILASASGPGQVAFLNDSIGSYYLAAFYDALEEGIVSDQPSSWASILAETARRVKEVRKKNQDPQFQIFKDDHLMVSYADREPDLDPIDDSEYQYGWEEKEYKNECMELIAFVLVDDFLDSAESDDDQFNAGYDRLIEFYSTELLRTHHTYYEPGLEFDLINAVLDVYLEPTYYELLEEARAHLAAMGPSLQATVASYTNNN